MSEYLGYADGDDDRVAKTARRDATPEQRQVVNDSPANVEWWRPRKLFRREDASLRAARDELRSAEEALSAQYWHMVDKYIGRERSIPDHVPEMRENARLQEVVWDRESIVRSLNGKQWDGDLEYSEALRELWDRVDTEEDQRYVESLSSEMDPLTGNRRAEIESAVREGRDGELTDLYVQWDQEIITAGLDDRPGEPIQIDREQLGGWAREGYLNTIDPLTAEAREVALDELEIAVAEDLAEPELAADEQDWNPATTERSKIIDECDRTVVNATSAKMLATTTLLELEPDVYPTRENYQAEWKEFKEDLFEEEVDERLDAIDPLTREDIETVQGFVRDEFERDR